MRIIKTYKYKRKQFKFTYDMFYNADAEQEIIDAYYKEIAPLYTKKRKFTL